MDAMDPRDEIPDPQLQCRRLRDGGLRADVHGRRSLAATQAYWDALLAEVRRMPPRWLLVVDELRGPPLTAEDWCGLVEAMRGRGLEGLRIAHVRPAGMAQLEHCEICARAAGIDARVFDDPAAAERWLRYGAPDVLADAMHPVPAGARHA